MKAYVVRSLGGLLFALSISLTACEKRVDDALLTARVKTQMTAEGEVSPTRVNVDTLNGVVTLKGEVPTQQEKVAAERAARKVEGVKSINNQIVVNPATAGTGVPSGTEVKEATKEAVGNVAQEVAKETGEALLLSKIKARLLAAGYSTVAVDVNQGEATLKGEVAGEKDRTAVEAIVQKVGGVKRINNQLAIKTKG
jgi:hyperosmotically inducible protein